MSKVTVFIANGTEESECLIIVDLLRRAGIETRLISITDSKTVVSSHDITIVADGIFDEENFDDSDMIFVPGGMPGVTNMLAHEGLKNLIIKFVNEQKRVGAVCAGPAVLGQAGVLEGKKATCFPGWEDKLNCKEYTGEAFTTDGLITTGRGLGCTIDEGLEIIRLLVSEEVSADIKSRIQHKDCI